MPSTSSLWRAAARFVCTVGSTVCGRVVLGWHLHVPMAFSPLLYRAVQYLMQGSECCRHGMARFLWRGPTGGEQTLAGMCAGPDAQRAAALAAALVALRRREQGLSAAVQTVQELLPGALDPKCEHGTNRGRRTIAAAACLGMVVATVLAHGCVAVTCSTPWRRGLPALMIALLHMLCCWPSARWVQLPLCFTSHTGPEDWSPTHPARLGARLPTSAAAPCMSNSTPRPCTFPPRLIPPIRPTPPYHTRSPLQCWSGLAACGRRGVPTLRWRCWVPTSCTTSAASWRLRR